MNYKNGRIKVRIIQEKDENKGEKKDKINVEEEVLKRILVKSSQNGADEMYREEVITQFEERKLTFEGKRNIIDKFYQRNLDILYRSMLTMLYIEMENESQERWTIKHGCEICKTKWKVFRCTNGKLRMIRDGRIIGENPEKIDEILHTGLRGKG
jgi:hypothetical protein